MKHSQWLTGLGLAISCLAAVAQSNNDTALIQNGAYLARAGDCVACHSAREGKPFAGGLGIQTPIGTIYSTNITPDRNTGIGDYSYADFEQAVRHGIAKDGSSLYPAMPYPSYARISDPDVRALYAYFMHGVEPVHQENRASDIRWPLSMRWPLTVWRWTFGSEVGEAPANDDLMLARGAYLVEGLGHCGSCHTPRSITLQEKALSPADGPDFLAGGAPLEGWFAKSLRGDHKDGLGNWSEAQLVVFFKTGRTEQTAVFGSMTEVVKNSLQYLSDTDRLAMARYLKSLPASHAANVPLTDDGSSYRTLHNGDFSKAGAVLYANNCMACHRSDGKGYSEVFPGLASNPVLNSNDATSLISIVLSGATLPGTNAAVTSFTMPAFGWRMKDQEVAEVLSFIRSSWGNQGEPISAADVAKVRKNLDPRTLAGDEVPSMEKSGPLPRTAR